MAMRMTTTRGLPCDGELIDEAPVGFCRFGPIA
jgi:hypothetical protein